MTTDLLTRTNTRLWTPQDLEILDAATRREFIAMLGAAGLLAACGSDGDDGPAAETRRIATPLGEVEVPVAAQRVLALDYFQGIAHDLGAPLVGRSSYVEPWKTDDPTYTDLALADGGDTSSVDVEKTAVLRPDLILCSTDQVGSVRAELQRLCAVVEVPGEYTLRWRDMWALIADAAGLPSPAGMLAQLDDRARDIAARRPPDLRTANIVRPSPDGEFRLYGTESFCGELVAAAGLEVGLTAAAEDSSLELLTEKVVGDLIFLWNDRPGDPDTAGLQAGLTTNPLWERLPAVAAGRVVRVDFHWIGNDPESADLALDDIDRAFATGGVSSLPGS